MSFKHDKFGTMDEEFSEYDFLGVEALDENDLSEDDESDVKISVASEEFRYIDPSTLLTPDKIVDGRELFSAKSYNEYVMYLNMFMGNPDVANIEIGYDIETNAENPLSPDIRIVGFSIADNPYRGIYVVGESLDFTMNLDEWKAIVDLTLTMFDMVKSVVVHNLGYEVPVTLNQWGYEFSPYKLEDTLAQGRTAYPKEPAGLKPMSALHLGFSDWDSELSTYLGSIKTIVNSLVHIDTARGARKRYNPEDLELRDKVFVSDSNIDTELLYGYLTSLREPVGVYDNNNKFVGEQDQLPFKIIPKVVEMLEVLSLNGIMNNEIFRMIIDAIVKHASEGGFTTNVPPYSIVPSELISRYGALDAIATVALREHLNEYMKVKSAEVRARQDKALGHSVPTSTFDLYEGYLNVKYQYFAGQYLEMSGAYWNDEVAMAERKWYEDTSVESWHNFINNEDFHEEFLEMNLDSYLYTLVRESLIELNSNVHLYERWIGEGLDGLYGQKLEDWESSYNSLSEVQRILIDYIDEYSRFDGSPGRYTIQKSQIKFYDRIVESVNSKTQQVTSKPEVIKLKAFYEELPGEVIDKLRPHVISVLVDDVSKVDTISGAKTFLNLSSTTEAMKQVLSSLLVTQEVKVGRLMEVLTAETQDTENFVRHWLDFNGNVLPGYEATKELYQLLEDDKRVELPYGKPHREVYDHFVNLLEVILEQGMDGVLVHKIIDSQEYYLEKLNEPAMIDLYRYSVLAGADVDDESTWSNGFRGLYDFRMYKKCVKMISSYIDGRVGRKSVQIVDTDDISSPLPKRKRAYYADYEDDDHKGYDDEELTLFTMRFAVAMAETGRWRSGFHTVPAGSTIKNIYSSRFKGGVIVAPDYSQLEVRVIGASAKEEGLLQAFRDGVDVHSAIARIVWNKPEVTEAERRYSKMVTFGILYGADEVNIANNFMNGDIDRATELVSNFYAGYPKLKTWVDSKHQEWKDTGYVTLMTNRMIKIPKPSYDDPKKRYLESKALRQAQNFPIQGAGSDIGGVALFRSLDQARQKGMKSVGFSYVHDALYFDIHPHEIFEMIKTVDTQMNDYPNNEYDLPVKADMVMGFSMGEELSVEKIEPFEDGNGGVIEVSGFKDEFDKLVDTWGTDVFSNIVVEELPLDDEGTLVKNKFISRTELFVPKKAISPWYGKTREFVSRRVTITIH